MAKLKNILVVIDHGYVSGGAAQVALSSLASLKANGLNVHLIFGVGPLDSCVDSREVICHDLGRHELLRNRPFLSSLFWGIWDFKAANRIGNLLKDFNTEDTVVHFHTWNKSLSSSVIRATWRSKFKSVFTLHDYFVACPNGGFYNYKTQESCTLKPLGLKCIFTNCDSRSYFHKLWRIIRQAVQICFGGVPSNADCFISVSKYSENILKPYLPSEISLRNIDNPIDTIKRKPNTPSDSSLFTFVGRLSPEKGADLLALAAQATPIRLCFVGSGDQESLIKSIAPGAIFLGWQDRKGVLAAISNSRALVMPSLWHETQGLVVAEAASIGVPSIVSDACAASSYILDGETGLLFKSGSSEDLRNKLLLLHKDPLKANALGMAAYQKFWNNPSDLKKHAYELVKAYEEILNESA